MCDAFAASKDPCVILNSLISDLVQPLTIPGTMQLTQVKNAIAEPTCASIISAARTLQRWLL